MLPMAPFSALLTKSARDKLVILFEGAISKADADTIKRTKARYDWNKVIADAHIIFLGQIISALTFLWGLICGCFFIRTRSLLAPILSHGLANACYLLMAAMFT